MKAFALSPQQVTEELVVGRVLCHDIVAVGESGRVKLGKGRVLTEADVPVLRTYSGELHLLQMEASDVHEDEASLRLARAVMGDGLRMHGPVESQTHLRAIHRGIVRVHLDTLEEINCLPDVSVYTVFNGQPVDSGALVAATKVTPLTVEGEVIEAAEHIARREAPLVSVEPFRGGKVGVIVRDRLAQQGRERFEASIHLKVGWFGSPVSGIRYLPDDVEAISGAIEQFVGEGAVLILAAGVNSTDPLDLTIQALDRLGAHTEKRGVPAHPGSTCWLSYLGDVPIFGLALCGMFSQTTVLDLLLPRFLSGRTVRAAEIASLGHGGVLGKGMAARFPSYVEEK